MKMCRIQNCVVWQNRQTWRNFSQNQKKIEEISHIRLSHPSKIMTLLSKTLVFVCVFSIFSISNAEDEMTQHQLSLADSLIDDVESLLSDQKPLLGQKKEIVPPVTLAKETTPRFQEQKATVTQVQPQPQQQQQPQFDFNAISNPPYVSALAAAQQQQQQQQPPMRFQQQQQPMRFQQQMGNFHLPGGNNPSPFNTNPAAFTFTNAQNQQMNNMANAFGGIPHQHPHPNAVHTQSVPTTSRFITAPGDENGVPPPMLFLERESSYQPQDTILKLESLYRDASGVNTHEGSAGQGRATSFSIDDMTNKNSPFKEDFEDGSMPHGENDEGASEFEFRGVSSHVVSRKAPLPGSNLANMYQNAKMYMPARQGSLQPFSSPMGQDVQRFKSVGKRRVDSCR